MINLFWNYMCGFLVIEVRGSSTERFVNMCAYHGIKVWDLEMIKNIYTFNIMLSDLNQLKIFSEKLEVGFEIKSRQGLPFLVKKLKLRPVFIPGMLVSLLLIYMYTFLLWDITIDGNNRYSDEELIVFLNGNEFYVSMFTKNIETTDIVSMMRNSFNDIIWVSVHLEGSSLVVKVKENQQLEDGDSVINTSLENNSELRDDDEHIIMMNQGTDIIAEEDGIIASIITRNGVPLVHVGDSVVKGQILVSGVIELTSDYEEVIDYQYVVADADIYLEKEIEYSEQIDLYVEEKSYVKFPMYSLGLKVGAWSWDGSMNFYNDSLYEVYTWEYTLHPQKQTKYSFVVGIEKYQKYELVDVELDDNEIKAILSTKFKEYTEKMKEKGVEIIENNVKIVVDEKYAVASGELKVYIYNTKTKASEFKEIVQIPKEIEE